MEIATGVNFYVNQIFFDKLFKDMLS